MQLSKAALVGLSLLATASLYATEHSQTTETQTTSAVTSTATAQSQTKQNIKLHDMTCEDFLAIDESFKPKAVYWAAAHVKGHAPKDAILDITGTERLIPVIIQVCKEQPKASFWEKIKQEYHKLV